MKQSQPPTKLPKTATQHHTLPQPSETLDAIDLTLIEELQMNARIPFAELGRRAGLSTPAAIDPAKLGLTVRAFVKIVISGDRLSNFAHLVRNVPEILECHRVTGSESFIVQVAVRDMNHLERVIDSLMPYVSTNTSMVLASPVTWNAISPTSFVTPKRPRG